MTKDEKEPFRIGVAGLGTVGAGVIKIIQQNAETISQRAGRSIEVVSVTASNKDKDRGVDVSSYDWADTLDDMAGDERLHAVIELIGGSNGPVKEMVEKSLQAGKHVVTANKALLAHHGYDLAKTAEDNNVALAYEAAVAGGIPIIKTLCEGLAANNIEEVYGILNGTCNYILSEMRETGRDFGDVLKEAQEKGYAEADPTFDVDGIDAAHKLALLGALAFSVKPDFDSLDITGISHITAKDISYANELGYRIKLLGMAVHKKDAVRQSVEPCLVPIGSALGSVEGVFNAVFTNGDFIDKTMMEGRGAGEGPTASSVVADIIDLARGNIRPAFGVPAKQLKDIKWQGMDDSVCQSYLHLKVKDEPGVLADITSCLGEDNISIDSFIQRGHDEDGTASVVIVTHHAPCKTVKKAIAAVEKLPCVLDKPVLLRIEDI